MTKTPHQAIAEQAYFLWLDDGMKHGKAEHHWALAEKLLTQPAAAVATPKAKKAKPAAKTATKTTSRAARAPRVEATLHS